MSGRLELTIETLTNRKSDFNQLRIRAEIDRLRRTSVTHPDENIRDAARQRAEFLEKELES